MLAVAVRIACAMVLASVPAGCGHDVTMPARLAGASVGTMAERELEAENPRLTHGALRCPDLDLHVGATVRCVRTTTLGNGTVVKVAGTVRVTSLASGGRLHVAMDTEAAEVGVAGGQVATALRRWYQQHSHRAADSVECPYLRGEPGARATCEIRAGSARRSVDAVVTRVDPVRYDVRYRFRPHRSPSPVPAS